MAGRLSAYILSVLLCFVAGTAVAADPVEAQQAELQKLHDYVTEVGQQVAGLQAALRKAEARNQQQSLLIDQLEASLRKRQTQSPAGQERIREAFFAELAAQAPLSPVYQVGKDRVVIAADPVFVFSRALLGAEGESRLAALATSLRDAVMKLPEKPAWRLRVEGHTDPRPLRSHREFPTNWELSAARATGVLRYLVRQGLPQERLEAVALAATVPRGEGRTKADFRRDRRIELHLEFTSPVAQIEPST